MSSATIDESAIEQQSSPRPRRHWAAKINQKIADRIRLDRAAGMSIQEVYSKWGPKVGLSYEGIKSVLYFRCWKG